jgi:hypothetical protein
MTSLTGGGDIIQQIGNLIRYWVNYDNTLIQLNKQVKKTRETRNAYETQILQMFRTANMTNPIIQIGGGRLVISEDKHTAPLTFTNLESLLHQYYASKPGTRDETGDIIKFIKTNRETTVNTCLKRQNQGGSRSV